MPYRTGAGVLLGGDGEEGGSLGGPDRCHRPRGLKYSRDAAKIKKTILTTQHSPGLKGLGITTLYLSIASC